MADAEKPTEGNKEKVMEWQNFIVTYPPGHSDPVAVVNSYGFSGGSYRIKEPEIELHCNECDGIRVFEAGSYGNSAEEGKWCQDFIYYTCKNCEKFKKVYAISLLRLPYKEGVGYAQALKLGEYQPFRPFVPAHVFKLFDDKEKLFKNGLSAESQNLGIGAFAYYRQIVEGHKDVLIDKIIESAKKEGVGADVIATLEAAKVEHQFLKSIEMIERILPTSLIIDDHNPLQALHAALSQGLHAKTDRECLELAQIIREVLIGLSERIADVLKKHSAFAKAVGTLARLAGQKGEDKKVEAPSSPKD